MDAFYQGDFFAGRKGLSVRCHVYADGCRNVRGERPLETIEVFLCTVVDLHRRVANLSVMTLVVRLALY